MNIEEIKKELGPGAVFDIGTENSAFAQFFVGQSYLSMLTTAGVPIGNVTFEPGCRNNWHIHHAKSGTRLLSGVGQGTTGTAPGRCGGNSRRRQALARGRTGQLVLPSGSGSAGRRGKK